MNKNSIPNDTRGPFITSGIRIGTPAITTRGFGVSEVKQVANMIARVLLNKDDELLQKTILEEVNSLCSRFPVYIK